MKPEDDPWLKSAHENAELIDRENQKLWSLSNPIRDDLPVITKYQDFWNQAKHITALFKELKPLARADRDLLWKRFNALCRDVKEKQKTEYGTLESVSLSHREEIMKHAEGARLPAGTPGSAVHDLVERGQALKKAGDLLGKYKHEMIAKHKKACFDEIQEIRRAHDAAWEMVKAGKPHRESKAESSVRENLKANRERYKKALSALENFQIGRDHILTFLASCKDPEKIAVAKAKLAETEARIRDIGEGILKLEQWIADDEERLK
ncbi:MAG: hypothetical protein WC586_07160 [Methanoregula sp.]